MSPFLRLVLTLVAVAVALNLLIVAIANARGQRRLAAERHQHLDALREILDASNGRLRRLEIAVEWQRIDAADQVLESSLLLRQDLTPDAPAAVPAGAPARGAAVPVARLNVPGDHLWLDGIVLTFAPGFGEGDPELAVLAGKRLPFFSRLVARRADDSPLRPGARPRPAAPEAQFAFLEQWRVPEVTRIAPGIPGVNELEQRVWSRVWELMPDLATLPGKWQNRGLGALSKGPVELVVKKGKAYTAFLTLDTLTIEEDQSPRALADLLEMARGLE
jgi:hypothetical protein